MSIIYWDSTEAEEIEAGTLGQFLPTIRPYGNLVTLDTETSGLFVDGDYTEGPPARVSAVSLAWRDGANSDIVTLALPFDQGRVGGKPGRWSDELDTYETLPHTDECVKHNTLHKASWPGDYCVCAPWNLNADDWYALCAWLQGKDGTERKSIDFHHAKFDMHIMRAGLRTVPNSGIDLSEQFVWDTQLAQGIIAPLESSALKPTAERLWGSETRTAEQAVKDAMRKNGVGLTSRYDLVAWDILGVYAGQDAGLTHRLFEYQQNCIETGSISATDYDVMCNEMELSRLLFKTECRGVGFDADGMRAESLRMEKEIEELEGQLPFQPPNVNAAKRYFFGELGIVPIKTTDVCEVCTFNRIKHQQRKGTKKELCKGQHKWSASLDSEVAARLKADKVPGADLWVDLANLNSALSKWYRAWPYKVGPDGRIRTNFRQGRIESDRKGMTSGGAISGRLSAERVQLQGVPQEWRIPKGIKPVKKFFRAKPGYQLWEIDASNAEVRVGAWLSQCKKLADLINSGVNIHDANTVNIFHIDDTDSKWTQYRTSAKRGIFGRMYGAGIRTLKSQIDADLKADIPERDIKAFMDKLDNEYPELKHTSRRCQMKVDKSMGGVGYVKLVNGRKRVFGWAERTHKAFNACIQGGVAEMMKVLMLMVEAKYPGALVNQVHDSIWVELPDLWADLQVKEIQDMGAELFGKTFSTNEVPIMFTFDAKRIA